MTTRYVSELFSEECRKLGNNAQDTDDRHEFFRARNPSSWRETQPSPTFGVLDVLTSLSDCRQEPVEKMERRISGVSYMYWMDFYNDIFCCGFSCARFISVSFLGLFSGYHAEGYHARAYAFKLTGYHVCRVTTPELPRSKQTSGYRQVNTPAGSF